jgi:hypothetical protein
MRGRKAQGKKAGYSSWYLPRCECPDIGELPSEPLHHSIESIKMPLDSRVSKD